MINDCEEKLPLKMDAEVEISKELVDSLTKLTGIDSISIGGKHI
jgi:hypothetical protein